MLMLYFMNKVKTMNLQNNNTHENSNDLEKVKKYMLGRRMCSLENIALQCSISFEKLYTILETLENNGSIRIAQKNCGSGCDDCQSSCSTKAIDKTAIIISLESGEASNDC